MVLTTSSSPKTYRALEGKYPEARGEERESTRRGISMIDTARGQIVRDAWRLAKPYWTSEEKWSAWWLLLAVIAFNVGNVYISVRINAWNNAFYNALQTFNSGELFRQLGTFCILVAFAIAMSVYAWLADQAYYQLQLRDRTDNPDQRIAEDRNQFTAYVLSLSLGLLTSAVSLVSFLVILWGLSGPAEIPLRKWGTAHIPGYLVWTALFYAGVGTWLTVKIGRPLVPLNVARQRFEADFRFSLVRFRENAESVALYGGEPVELRVFNERFRSVAVQFPRPRLKCSTF